MTGRNNEDKVYYNIKLPRNFRDRFSRPYSKFLRTILHYSDMLTPEIMVAAANEIKSGPKDWLIWLDDQDKSNFKRIKQNEMPSATNAQFINALLMIHEAQHLVKIKDIQESVLNATRQRILPKMEKKCRIESQMVTYGHSSKRPQFNSSLLVIHKSEHLNTVENNPNGTPPKLLSQVKNNRFLQPPIDAYRNTSKSSINPADPMFWPQIEKNGVLQRQIITHQHTSKPRVLPVVHKSEHLNSVKNNQNAAWPKLWSQVKNDGVLKPPIATYRHSSKVVKHRKTLSYKINGIELLYIS